MQNYIWIALFILVLVLLRKRRMARIAAIRHIKNKNQNKENEAMRESAKQFIGKDCIVYTVSGSDGTIKGTVKEVTGDGMIIERADGKEAVNLEYVTRIREWPRNAKGKKKQIFE